MVIHIRSLLIKTRPVSAWYSGHQSWLAGVTDYYTLVVNSEYDCPILFEEEEFAIKVYQTRLGKIYILNVQIRSKV